MAEQVCVVLGVGPGNGAAFARRFDREGFRVACMARSGDVIEPLARELGEGMAVHCDAADPDDVRRALGEVQTAWGRVDVLVYNAGSGLFGSVDDVDEGDLERAWRINTLGLFAATRACLPGMRTRGHGQVVVIGATASVRGGAGFAAFAPAKAAQRALAQSMARKLGPEGIHVGLLIIDGVIDSPRTRAMMSARGDDEFLQPADIADAVVALVRQPRSAWTFELDLRPFREKW
jgi:NADP-dependent 3-hydroxy acid dehydrogenase YdfG